MTQELAREAVNQTQYRAGADHHSSTNDHAIEQIANRLSQLSIAIADASGLVSDLVGFGDEQRAVVDQSLEDAQEMSRSNRVLAQSLSQSRTAAHQTAKILDETTSSIAHALETSTGTLNKLGTGSIEIQTALSSVERIVTDIRASSTSIAKIAQETQLLALNASVEAARAGEAGRGFAVIAQAVKVLADQIKSITNQNGESTDMLAAQIAQMLTIAQQNATTAQDAENISAEAHEASQELTSLKHTVSTLVDGIETMSIPAQKNLEAFEQLDGSLSAIGELAGRSHQHLATTRKRTDDILSISEDFMRFVASSGAETEDTPFINLVMEKAAEISHLFEEEVANGDIGMHDLFDQDYTPIEGTDPVQYSTRYIQFTDYILPDIQEPVLKMDERIAFCAAVDTNGFLPTHNNVYSRPQSDDPVWNAANCRNRRIFDDRTGLSAGRNTKEFLLQTYRRDMGGGNFVLMKDVSAPIFVNGRHWGGLRLAYKV